MQSGGFSVFIESWAHQHSLIVEHFHPIKKRSPPPPFCPLPSPWQSLFCLLSRWLCLFCTFHANGTMRCVVVSDSSHSELSVSKVGPHRSACAARVPASLRDVTLYGCALPARASVGAHLGGFPFVNNAAVKFLHRRLSSLLLGIYLVVQLLGPLVTLSGT